MIAEGVTQGKVTSDQSLWKALVTTGYLESCADTLITITTHLTMQLITINVVSGLVSCCWWVQAYFCAVCFSFCFFSHQGGLSSSFQCYADDTSMWFFFLTTQSHLISLNLLWMSTFWNVSVKICHYPPNVLLHFFCHLSCASWRQGIAPLWGSCYTFCLPSHLFITWKHFTSRIHKEKEI